MSFISSIKHDADKVGNAIDSHKTDAEIAGGVTGGVAAAAGGGKVLAKAVSGSTGNAFSNLSPEEQAQQLNIVKANLAKGGLAGLEGTEHAAPQVARGVATGVEEAPKG